MRVLYFGIWLLLFTSCRVDNKQNRNEYINSPELISFDWLLGDWQRENEDEGKSTFERWNKKSDLEYRGFGYTLQKMDTIWQEDIKLIKKDNIWNFEVMGNGEASPTIFTVTDISTNSFICENPENEFPTHIQYEVKGEHLNAKIWGGDMEIPFVFVKK
jgi:hypothetical protein